jgi:hypothetical protein
MPKVIQEYNSHIGGVDLLDKHISFASHKDQVKEMVVATFHSNVGCCSYEYMDGISNCKQRKQCHYWMYGGR